MVKILLIEDNINIVEVLLLLAETSKKFELISTDDETKVLDLLKENKIDVIVCDYVLLTGPTDKLIKRIKEQYDIPLILSTGYDEDHYSGVIDIIDGVIKKPFGLKEFCNSITSVIKGD